jgi:hypothetical protein
MVLVNSVSDSRLPLIALLAAVAPFVVTACGSDADTSAAAPDVSVPAPSPDEEAASVEQVDLSPTQRCLEELGIAVAPGDETTTALTPSMMDSLGIDAILVFDKGAGWGGTVEAYRSTEQADVAEIGYVDGPWGFEVGRVADIVFKTTGPADDLVQIESCLTDG